MPLDSSYLIGEKGVPFVKGAFNDCFGASVELQEENVHLEHHGWFRLGYIYLPKGYIINCEAEFNGFNIDIINGDGGFIALAQLVEHKHDLRKDDVQYAIKKLKEILESEISFYKSINYKLYKQVDGEYKRVKDWMNRKNEK